MAGPIITDGRGHDVIPTSEAELVEELRRLDAEFRGAGEPRIVVIYGDAQSVESPRLSIGLGADEATLVYDEGLSGAFSRGRHRDDESDIGYEYGDGYSEFPGWTRIPREDALGGAREFFRTGRRPTTVDWVDQ